MNVVKEIQRLNAHELFHSTSASSSWHAQYASSAYIYIGGLPYNLTEGDVIAVFSQYGEVVDVNLVRDKETGKSKGFAFLAYEDQRSTTLAVDNLNGIKITGRIIRVDHVKEYKSGAEREDYDAEEDLKRRMHILPDHLKPKGDAREDSEIDTDDDEIRKIKEMDEEDPMRAYLLNKAEKRRRKAKRRAEKDEKRKGKSEHKHKKRRRSPSAEGDDRRHRNRR
ncbi:hypothetical protein HDU85_002210 [Gaertneriomyces sp. JEL0708]|nr:hypothetical protein HDU85_002210 [Gaertneriomyces sp. JEL0708]